MLGNNSKNSKENAIESIETSNQPFTIPIDENTSLVVTNISEKESVITLSKEGTKLWELSAGPFGEFVYWIPDKQEKVFIGDDLCDYLIEIHLTDGRLVRRQLNRKADSYQVSLYQDFFEFQNGSLFLYEKGLIKFDTIGSWVWETHDLPNDALFVGIQDDLIIFGDGKEDYWAYLWASGQRVEVEPEPKPKPHPIPSFFFVILSFAFGLPLSISLVKVLANYQAQLFSHPKTVFFVSGSGNAPLFLAVALLFFLFQVFCSISHLLRPGLGFRQTKGSSIALFIYFVIFFFTSVYILLSYCNVTPSGVYVRDMRTHFSERYYPWKQVKELRIVSDYDRFDKEHKESELQLIMNIGSVQVNLLNSSWLEAEDNQPGVRKVFAMTKEFHIPIIRQIHYIDERDRKTLAYIEGQ